MKYLPLLFLATGLTLRLAGSPLASGDTDIDFERAARVLTQALENAPRVEIYEGLPRDQAASGKQKEANIGRQIADQWFYSVPDELRVKHVQKLHRLIEGGLFAPWREGKLCGGFHADYAIALTFPKVTYYVLFSFGCHEAKIIREGNPFAMDVHDADFRVTTDLNGKSFEELRSLLTGYHNPERDGG